MKKSWTAGAGVPRAPVLRAGVEVPSPASENLVAQALLPVHAQINDELIERYAPLLSSWPSRFAKMDQ